MSERSEDHLTFYRAVFSFLIAIILLLPTIAAASDLEPNSKDDEASEIISLWPFFDYRSSPSTRYSNLSILGPIFKFENDGDKSKLGIRPLFFTVAEKERCKTDILYPIAYRESDSGSNDTDILKLYQSHTKIDGDKIENSTMLFPFYISGKSEKYGEYSSVFPFYGDIYERFWRDEYHYIMFPIYSETLKQGKRSTNWLYPLFSKISGENESGFSIFPIYGHSEKVGVYEKSFALFPIYNSEVIKRENNQVEESFSILPFYASTKSPEKSSRHIPWPTTGVVKDASGNIIERDYFWPFWMEAKSDKAETNRYLPFYSISKNSSGEKRWIAWPIYSDEKLDTAEFKQNKTSLLYFLFKNSEEEWVKTGERREKSGFWPLYQYEKDADGVSKITIPAIVENVISNESIENNWAPLWRLFIHKADQTGNSATSLLWNLFWHEKRKNETAWELNPFFSYRSRGDKSGFKLLKGIFGYDAVAKKDKWSIFWIKF